MNGFCPSTCTGLAPIPAPPRKLVKSLPKVEIFEGSIPKPQEKDISCSHMDLNEAVAHLHGISWGILQPLFCPEVASMGNGTNAENKGDEGNWVTWLARPLLWER